MKKLYLSFLFILLAVFILPVKVFAEDKPEENATIQKNEVISQNPYFTAGNIINISGTINGDVFAAGNTIIISGKVNGDVFAAGSTIKVTGLVANNLFVAGGSVAIDGKIGGRVIAGSGNLDLGENAQVGKYLMAGGGNISLLGPIGGNLFLGAGLATLGSSVKGNARILGGELHLTSTANITGDLDYWSENDITIDSQAKIGGEVTKHLLPQKVTSEKLTPSNWKQLAKGVSSFILTFKVLKFISILIAGLILLHFFPKVIKTCSDNITSYFWKSMGLGFLSMIIIPIGFVILLITVVGIPLAMMALAIYVIISYFSQIVISFWLGEKLLANKPVWGFVLSLLVITVLCFIPIIGGVINFLIFLVGTGALLITKNQLYKEAKSKDLI